MNRVAVAAIISLLSAPAVQAAECSDVALVLAIDASSSIDATEFDLQIAGYRDALSSPEVGESFRKAGTVQIAAVFWADSAYAPQIVPWHLISDHGDLSSFATILASTERRVTGNTDMGTGLKAALDLFGAEAICAERLVIDVSGDGRATVNARRGGIANLGAERKRAKDLGVIVNGLAITGNDAGLADYYRSEVALGLSSFVMEVNGFATFHEAIAQKLMREVLADSSAPDGELGRL
ncbi:DUF1194 domain-containing protein [Tabrizicola sp. J26]|uniref:DUF1194 domain-containing protein n=1 Tax=Alitabrizicola rongguiensis TaxID=2909234 RepID=UPI001F19471D|nr:DUF1194 domain-containing protein [Tabrizicola rongguiensis]MCF1709604.1 DUF1194 domain-containing protein [Tabrizicola rongguiensis]